MQRFFCRPLFATHPDRSVDMVLLLSVWVFATLGCLLILVRAGQWLQLPPYPGLFTVLATAFGLLLGAAAIGFRLRVRQLIPLAGLALFAVGYAFAVGLVMEATPDGLLVHLAAVLTLAEGWSPLSGPAAETLRVPLVSFYANGLYSLQAVVIQLTGMAESGKLIIPLMVIGTGALVLAVMLQGRRPVTPLTVLFIGALVLNPVVLGQWFSHYVDAGRYLFSLSLILAFLLAYAGRPGAGYGLATVLLVLLINSKTAGLYDAGLIVAVMLLAGLVMQRHRLRAALRLGLWTGGLMVFATLIATTLVGYRPYVTNWTEQQAVVVHPPTSVMLAGHHPANLLHQSHAVQLWHTIFAATGNQPGEVSELKFPGTVTLSELKSLGAGTYRGGFGPYFGLVVILSLATVVMAALVRLWMRKKSLEGPSIALWLVGAAGLCLLLAGLFPEPWLARFIPLLWATPILLLLALPTTMLWHPLLRGITAATVLAICLNLLLCGAISIANAGLHTVRINKQLAELARLNTPVLLVQNKNLGDHKVWGRRLQAREIPYRVVWQSDTPAVSHCAEPMRLTSRLFACTTAPLPESPPQ